MFNQPLSRRDLLKAGAIGTAGLSALGNPLPLLAQAPKGITGQAAPELAVPYWIDGEGKETSAFSIASNKGKWVILKCFQNWCPGCHSLGFPGLQKITAALENNDKVAIAAIQTTFEGFSTNNQDALLKNQRRYELSIPFGHDEGDASAAHGDRKRMPKTMLSYRTGGTPWFVVIDPRGRVVYNHFHVDSDRLIEILKKETSA
ncbi:MAG: peroxiredoxin family protein [Cellvibrionaceae bacterium]